MLTLTYRVTKPWERREATQTASSEIMMAARGYEDVRKAVEAELLSSGKFVLPPEEQEEAFEEARKGLSAAADQTILSDFAYYWNRYSENWPSPEGVLPVIEIIEVKEVDNA